MLFAEERAIFGVCGEKLGAVSYLCFKASRVFAEHLVEKTDIARRPRPDWLTILRQLQRARLPLRLRQQVCPIFRSIELAHASVMRVEDDSGGRIDVIRR